MLSSDRLIVDQVGCLDDGEACSDDDDDARDTGGWPLGLLRVHLDPTRELLLLGGLPFTFHLHKTAIVSR